MFSFFLSLFRPYYLSLLSFVSSFRSFYLSSTFLSFFLPFHPCIFFLFSLAFIVSTSLSFFFLTKIFQNTCFYHITTTSPFSPVISGCATCRTRMCLRSHFNRWNRLLAIRIASPTFDQDSFSHGCLYGGGGCCSSGRFGRKFTYLVKVLDRSFARAITKKNLVT